MRNYCLVDYENIHEPGLNGIFELNENDKVIIFYTKNANSISLDLVRDILKKGVKADIDLISVPSGNQSLDKLLISHLGYLIGTNINEDVHFVIVSKDKGYNNTADYWNSTKSNLVEIRLEISSGIKTQNVAKKPEKAEEKAVLDRKSIMNQNVQKILSKDKAKYSNDVISQAASICAKKVDTKNQKSTTLNALVKKLGEELGREIYTKLETCSLFN